ncbi:MAG: hypothetical protein WB239_19045 [Acidimicrobiia bacterium]
MEAKAQSTGEGERRPLRRTLRWPAALSIVIAGLVVTALAGDAITLCFMLPYVVTGAVLVVKRPENAIGWLLMLIGIEIVGATLPVRGNPGELLAGRGPWFEELVAWPISWGWNASLATLFALTVLFPTGRMPSGRPGLWARVFLLASVFVAVLVAFAPTITIDPVAGPPIDIVNPLALVPGARFWSLVPPVDLLLTLQMVVLLGGAISILLRYRRAAGVERPQLRWLVAALGLASTGVLIGFPIASAMGLAKADPRSAGVLLWAVWTPALAGFMAVPVAVAVAVLRYRLYRIDHIISRTLAYTLLTLAIAAVYAGSVVALAAILGETSDLVVAGSTLVAAALFNPLRARLVAAVDRRFNRSHYDREFEVGSFGARLSGRTDMAEVTDELIGVVDRALVPALISVWTRTGPGPIEQAAADRTGIP